MIEPTIDALTTSWRPFSSAKKAMISSGALPNVTFRNPPMPGPVRVGELLRGGAHQRGGGDDASAAAEKIRTGEACANSSATATGMKMPR